MYSDYVFVCLICVLVCLICVIVCPVRVILCLICVILCPIWGILFLICVILCPICVILSLICVILCLICLILCPIFSLYYCIVSVWSRVNYLFNLSYIYSDPNLARPATPTNPTTSSVLTFTYLHKYYIIFIWCMVYDTTYIVSSMR